MVKINKYVELDINEIDLRNDKFLFSFPEESNELLESIKRTGLLNAPLLHLNHVICGRRRILACKKLGIRKINAGILNSNSSELDLFILAIEDNSTNRKFNIIEKSAIINKLLNVFKTPKKVLVAKYLPFLGVPADIRYINKYIWIDNLKRTLKMELLEKNVSLSTLNIISDWPEDKKKKTLEIVMSFGFGNNKVSDILNLLNEISLRDNSAPSLMYNSEACNKICNNPNLSLYQKGERFRALLFQKRYPNYSEFKGKLKNLTKKLALSENIKIDLDNLLTMEDERISFNIQCKSKKDLGKTISKLEKLKNSEELQQLLDLLKMPL